ncbi:class IV adenylate cyclase [Streptosporangium saharense]|uniref:Adenylate cyclase class 2 n=1 Tax=Streptosporangium saharense TaxID=1706840 RepID=A0A7W7VKD2_9ACTN|nr:class IV adenylate cyclase [Streptosporangium saharense]MBB4913561.1 adenylate cyclase class 2 [Streptosporangium saharense]
MKYIEVEQKYVLTDPEALKAKLKGLDAVPGTATRQIDSYFNAPHRDFLEPQVISEWLRIRESDRGASVNFKLWHPVDAVTKTHADEYETGVEDPEAVRLILTALGFTPLVTVDKTREEWTVPGTVAVAFDTLADAGTFVEFEFKGEADGIDDAIEQLDGFIAGLDVPLGERVARGYPHMLLDRDH